MQITITVYYPFREVKFLWDPRSQRLRKGYVLKHLVLFKFIIRSPLSKGRPELFYLPSLSCLLGSFTSST